MLIYKILRPHEWEIFRTAGEYTGSVDDQRDGFIHFSTREQMPGTLAKHYGNEDVVTITSVEADSLGSNLKWEVSRGGASFPHLYATLPFSQIISVRHIENTSGGFDLAALDLDA